MKPFQIKNNCYALASTDGNSAELTLYGDIYEQQPTDWWTGEPIEGQFVLLTDFLKDLEQIKGCKSLLVRINSYGGDAGVSNTIHNRLRELSRDGGCKITCIVDGAAMSGGSLIMCACDTVRVNPSSMIMIHKGWTFIWGSYNADELRDTARTMDAWDKMQVEIYKRKTGLSDTVLLHMMADTTYLSGREAVEKGFADELIEDAEPLAIAASADGRSLFVRGHTMRLAPGMFAPDSIPTAAEPAADPTVEPGAPAPAQTYNETPAVTGEEEGGIPMTIDELRAQYPDEVGQIEANARASADHTEAVNAAVQAERTRMQEIDAVAALYSTDVVQAAKYGDNPCSAQEMTYRAAQAQAQQGNAVLQQMNADAQAANTANVPAANSADANETKEDVRADAKAAAKAFLKDKEGK